MAIALPFKKTFSCQKCDYEIKSSAPSVRFKIKLIKGLTILLLLKICFLYSITSLFFGCCAGFAFVVTIYPAETFNVLAEGYIAFACMTLNIVFHISPMIVFYFIFAIETQNLVNWVRILRTKIDSQDFMHSFSQYVIALDYAKGAFSFNIFWNILALCSSAIICVFRGANARMFK